MSAARQSLLAICAIPVGAVGGFVCAALVVAACSLFVTQVDRSLLISYIFTAAVVPGAVIGALLLPIVYLACFRHLEPNRLVVAGLWIGVGVLSGGLLASIGRELVALLGSLIGFAFGVRIASERTKLHENAKA